MSQLLWNYQFLHVEMYISISAFSQVDVCTQIDIITVHLKSIRSISALWYHQAETQILIDFFSVDWIGMSGNVYLENVQCDMQ